jgi:hypothetical protein
LNQTGKLVHADVVVKSYAVCNAHADLPNQPGFDIQKIWRQRDARSV